MNTETLQPTTSSPPSAEAPLPATGVESQTLQAYLRDQYRRGRLHRPVRQRAKSWLTSVIVPLEIRKARRLARERPPLKLHLGCGNTYLDDWVNIDLARPGRRLDVCWDLRRGLPFPNDSAEAIFSEHLFEHIPIDGAFTLMKESRRVLAPGGVFRVVVPDLERYVRSYVEGNAFIQTVRPGRPTTALALTEIFFRYDHHSMYDPATMKLMLSEAGFGFVEESSFGQGCLNPNPDSEYRRAESMYVEAVVV